MGKLVAAFVFFLAASALAIHESKPPPPPPPIEDAAPARVRPSDEAPPPSRAIHDAVPPWVKYAAQPADHDSGDDIPDVVDKCPDQPTSDDSDDGCPEPARDGIEGRVIVID